MDFLALGDSRRRRAGRRHRAHARRHGRALVRRRHRLHQDRTDPGGGLRARLSWRYRDLADDGGDRRCHRGRSGHVDQTARHGRRSCSRRLPDWPPGGMFALSAIGFRGGILSLGLPNYVMAATFTLAIGHRHAGGSAVALILAAQSLRNVRASRAPGSLRYSPALPARSPRSSGSWPLRLPPPRAYARSL